MRHISRERLELALDQLKAEHGIPFERFANAFLAGEFAGLRPVGGMHDSGRDAFIGNSEHEPDYFVQSSVTPAWKKKVRATVTTLRNNGFAVRTLVYCTPHNIQADATAMRVELRAAGVTLDIRDREYFLTPHFPDDLTVSMQPSWRLSCIPSDSTSPTPG